MEARTNPWLTGNLALALALAVGCGDDGNDAGASGSGGGGGTVDDRYYAGAASMALGADSNEADCALCHSDDGTTAGYSGTSFQDIAYRESFKGGGAPTLRDASNACVTGWMGGEALTEDDPAWLALEAFLQSISDPSVTGATDVSPEVLADQAAYEAAYTGGDAAAGEAKYALYCGKCHEDGTVVGSAPAWNFEALGAQSIGRIAQKVRTAGPPPSGTADTSDSTPGPMPFFEPDELSPEDLADIIAHIKGA